MGGPKAFKEMQKRQQEFHSRWDQEEQANIGSDEDDAEGSSSGKRDIYSEYSLPEGNENAEQDVASDVRTSWYYYTRSSG